MFVIVGEMDAPSVAAGSASTGGEAGYLVWKLPEEVKKGSSPGSETQWIDGSGRVLRRSKTKDLISVIGDAVYTVRIEKRKVKVANWANVNRQSFDPQPELIDAEEPELLVVKTEPDGKKTETIIVKAEGDKGAEKESKIDVLGLVGTWLFAVSSTYYYGGGAHGGMAYSMIVCNVETGKTTAPATKLLTDQEYASLMKALGKKAVKAINDEMITSADGLNLTKMRPIVNNDELGIEVLLTGGTCYACSDGLWDSYTRSAALVSPVCPGRLAPYRAISPAVLAWWKASKQKGYPSWSTVPESGLLRKRLEELFQ